MGKPVLVGVDVGQHLSLTDAGKACEGDARVANPAPAGEIRPSGMKRGALGNVAMGAGLRLAA